MTQQNKVEGAAIMAYEILKSDLLLLLAWHGLAAIGSPMMVDQQRHGVAAGAASPCEAVSSSGSLGDS